jgi:hypothetical protein
MNEIDIVRQLAQDVPEPDQETVDRLQRRLRAHIDQTNAPRRRWAVPHPPKWHKLSIVSGAVPVLVASALAAVILINSSSPLRSAPAGSPVSPGPATDTAAGGAHGSQPASPRTRTRAQAAASGASSRLGQHRAPAGSGGRAVQAKNSSPSASPLAATAGQRSAPSHAPTPRSTPSSGGPSGSAAAASGTTTSIVSTGSTSGAKATAAPTPSHRGAHRRRTSRPRQPRPRARQQPAQPPR